MPLAAVRIADTAQNRRTGLLFPSAAVRPVRRNAAPLRPVGAPAKPPLKRRLRVLVALRRFFFSGFFLGCRKKRKPPTLFVALGGGRSPCAVVVFLLLPGSLSLVSVAVPFSLAGFRRPETRRRFSGNRSKAHASPKPSPRKKRTAQSSCCRGGRSRRSLFFVRLAPGLFAGRSFFFSVPALLGFRATGAEPMRAVGRSPNGKKRNESNDRQKRLFETANLLTKFIRNVIIMPWLVPTKPTLSQSIGATIT